LEELLLWEITILALITLFLEDLLDLLLLHFSMEEIILSLDNQSASSSTLIDFTDV